MTRLLAILDDHGFLAEPLDDGLVTIEVSPGQLVSESRRLQALLTAHGIAFDQDTCLSGWFDPVDNVAFIDVFGVTDAMLWGLS